MTHQPWSRAALLLWPVALFAALAQIRDTLVTTVGGDFQPVWHAAKAFVEGGNPYGVNAFVYPPSALLLFAPFGAMPYADAHVVFHIVNAASIVLAAVLAFRLFGVRVTDALAPAIIFALFISAPVRLTLYTENVNGVILATQMGALAAALSGRWTMAGAVFGLGLAIKPVLLPLLLLPMLARQWRCVAAAVAVPLGISALAVPMLGGGSAFVTDVVPFLLQGNNPQNAPINTSIAGAVANVNQPAWIATVLRALVILATPLLIWFRSRGTDKAVVAAELMAIILAATFLAFSFSWPYYALYLVPLGVAFARSHTVLENWRLVLLGIALYCVASQDYFPRFGSVRVTLGYLTLLAAFAPGMEWVRTAAPVGAAAGAQPEAAPEAPRIAALDGLRGIAILLVMLGHFSAYARQYGTVPGPVANRVYHLFEAGWVGVDLFFVLSGFLITGILYDAKGAHGYFRNFYARRVLRIFPLYYGTLVMLFIVLPWIRPGHEGLQSIAQDAPWYWTYLSNFLIARDGWPEFSAVGHFWSLAIEEQFYLLWPLAVFLLNRRQLQIVTVACVILALALRLAIVARGNTLLPYVLTPTRFDALAIGAFLALAARAPGGLRALSRFAVPTVAGLSALLVGMFAVRGAWRGYDPLVVTVGLTLQATLFGAALVVAVMALRGSRVEAFFSSSFLRFFGRYSYGLYVFHVPLLGFMPGLLPLAMLPTLFGSTVERLVVFSLIATTMCVGVAVLSYHLFELQFLKLKRYFPYRG